MREGIPGRGTAYAKAQGRKMAMAHLGQAGKFIMCTVLVKRGSRRSRE